MGKTVYAGVPDQVEARVIGVLTSKKLLPSQSLLSSKDFQSFKETDPL